MTADGGTAVLYPGYRSWFVFDVRYLQSLVRLYLRALLPLLPLLQLLALIKINNRRVCGFATWAGCIIAA